MQYRLDRPGVNIGDVDALTGIAEGVNGNLMYFLWGMKEPDYVMRMMATGGPLTRDESCKLAD